MRALGVFVVVAALLASCARAPLKKREEALRPTGAPSLADDLPLEPLIAAVRQQASVVKLTSGAGRVVLGKRTLTREEYAYGLETFARLAETIKDRDQLFKAIRESFDFYEAYGGDGGWGEVLVTSYFEPEVTGSLRKSDRYSQALLRAPGDLVEVAVSKYDDRFSDIGQMRGRLVALGYPPGKLQLVPYYSRDEIDYGGALAKRGLELAWVDPIDAFFIQIQGSATVVLENGQKLRVGYADQNGHKYESIGKFMLDVLPKDKVTMPTIEAYLRGLSVDRLKGYLVRNPSYVFFREREGEPTTAYGTPAAPGRTIATDARYFPKGTLAFLQFPKPKWDSEAAPDPAAFDKTSRFVVDDDTGGAIRGGGRVDLFWGYGAEARRNAGVIKGPGRLYYLAPKDELLKSRPPIGN